MRLQLYANGMRSMRFDFVTSRAFLLRPAEMSIGLDPDYDEFVDFGLDPDCKMVHKFRISTGFGLS